MSERNVNSIWADSGRITAALIRSRDHPTQCQSVSIALEAYRAGRSQAPAARRKIVLGDPTKRSAPRHCGEGA